jgi:hypothetical protein
MAEFRSLELSYTSTLSANLIHGVGTICFLISNTGVDKIGLRVGFHVPFFSFLISYTAVRSLGEPRVPRSELTISD